MMTVTELDAARFWDKVPLRANDECWPWLAKTVAGPFAGPGYGAFRVDGKSRKAHRVMFRIVYGYEPPVVMHTCDNRPCVNPAHLRPGTYLSNTRDAVAKGRHPRGAKVPTAKLNEEKVRAIVELLRKGVRQRDVAAQFGVSRRTVNHISVGRAWTHVTGGPLRVVESWMDRWAKAHECCLGCGTTEIPHVARGLCRSCYTRAGDRRRRGRRRRPTDGAA